MKQKILPFLLLYLTILLTTKASRAAIPHIRQAPSDSTYSHLYEKGMKLVNDHPLAALNTWLSAKNFGKQPDPRIGIHFVETVTKNRMKRYYDQASEMYFWGISGKKVVPYHNELMDELKRLQPLMKDDHYKKMRGLLDQNEPRFYSQLRLFWQTRDPMPSTPKNEYLLTVWERITYVRKHFKHGSYSAYGTDARGPVYVKFGKPDDHYSELPANLDVYGPKNNFLNVATRSSSPRNKIFKLSESSPNLTFWIYKPETVHTRQNMIYIFGTIPQKRQRFGIIKSLDELIPNRLTHYPGAGYHQTLLNFRAKIYKEYRTVDPFFYHEYIDMTNLAAGQVGNTRTYASQNKARTTTTLQARQSRARPVESDEDIPDFKSNIKTYSFFDANRQPYSIAVIYSYPEKLLAANKYNEAVSGINSKKVINHTLQVIGPADDSLQTFQNVPDMELSSTVIGDRVFPVVSIFKLPHEPSGARLHGTAELISYDKNQHAKDKVSFIGLHDENQKLEKKAPSDKNSWFISAPVLGYKKNDTKLKDNPFPFYPAPKRIIPRGKNVNLYFELYDFSPANSQRVPYRVSYNISQQQGLLSRIFGGKDNQKVTLRQTKSKAVEPNQIEIKTSELKPDDYTLHFTVTNPGRDRSIEKEIDFTIK